MSYHNFSPDFADQLAHDLAQRWESPYRCQDSDLIRRDMNRDTSPRLNRTAFGRDIDKIIHMPAYNRYTGKTQVFSFIRNDDISHRGLHVQLVARTATNIARMLGLNIELTEAIALAHDLGHTPFGHAGEKFLDDLYQAHAGRYFHHNVHSVRVLDTLYTRNMSLQTLDGVICHNGENTQKVFKRGNITTFDQFDKMVERCYTEEGAVGTLRASTLEGCVVRISDMIAYVGKDRQDALKTKSITTDEFFTSGSLGTQNAEILNNLTVDIVEASYGKNHIEMSEAAYQSLATAKAENFERIYLTDEQALVYDNEIKPMFSELYDVLYRDLTEENLTSPIFAHHIEPLEKSRARYGITEHYTEAPPVDIVVDYLASMTDEYFLALHKLICPDSTHSVTFKGYFDHLNYKPLD